MPLTRVHSRNNSQIVSINNPYSLNSVHIIICPSLKQLSQNGRAAESAAWRSLAVTETIESIHVHDPINSQNLISNYIRDTSDDGLRKNADDLLSSLQALQIPHNNRFILIGYSFGSAIVKDAMICGRENPGWRAIYDQTIHIIFIDSINNTTHGDFNKAFSRCAWSEIGESKTKRQDLDTLKDSTFLSKLKALCDQFNANISHYNTTGFYGEKETAYSIPRMLGYTSRKHRQLIPKELESLFKSTHTSIALDCDHEELSGFPSPQSLLIYPIKEVIDQVARDLSRNSQNHTRDTSTYSSQSAASRYPRSKNKRRDKGPASEPSIRSQRTALISWDPILPCYYLDPYQGNPAFTGRREILEVIKRALDPRSEPRQSKLALIGMPGMGKTQIALKYAFDCKQTKKFEIILLGQAETRAKLANSFVQFDQSLGLQEHAPKNDLHNQKGSRERVKRFLQSTDKPWLLIFDNVEKAVEDNSSSLGDFWPTGDKGSILITTRNDSVLGPLFRLNATIEYISGLPMQDSIDYLFKVTGIRQTNLNYEHAETIYERIRGHPLSLVTIASIVSSKRIDFKEYIDLYPNLRLFDEAQTISGPETYYPYSMSTAFHTALSGIEDSVGDNNAWRLLHLLSFLDPDGVEEEDLRQGAVGSNQPTLQDIVDHRSFEENRSLLCERNAIGRNTELKTLLMHRLTQDYCHSKMTSQSAQVAFDSAFYLLHKLWPVPERHSRHQQELWPTQERLVNHVVSLGNYWKISQEFNESTSLKASIQFAELLYNSAWYFYERGNFSSADTLLKVAKMYCHTNPTNCQVVLADIYGAYGSRYSECNEAQACFDNFSEQHRYIQTSIQLGLLKSPDIREALAEAGIGVGKMALKKYAEAEKAFRNCLEIWKDCPGEPSIYVPHLGVCLTLQGKLSEAEKLLTNIIAQRAAQFGERDRTSFRTGVIYLAYGNLQIKQKRFEEAYRTHLFAMEMLAETVGKEHHRYADACYKVGWHQHRRNELDAARNEEARVYFKLGEIAAKKGSLVEAKGNRDKAEQCRKIVHGQQDLPLGLEEDYDESIMFWSR